MTEGKLCIEVCDGVSWGQACIAGGGGCHNSGDVAKGEEMRMGTVDFD